MESKIEKGIKLETQAKKLYRSPSLMVYGDIRSLTTGGTGANPEPPTPNKNRQRP